MLFLPRYEKRIMGMKVPFTPGLLPKSKSRMAHSVGETVGSYLLTEDSIKEAIIHSGFENILNDFMDKAYGNLCVSDKRLSYYLEKPLEENRELVEELKTGFKHTVKTYIVKNKEEILRAIYKEIKNSLMLMDAEKYYIEAESFISEKASEKYKAVLENGGLYPLLENFLKDFNSKISDEEKSLSQIIPSETIEGIKKYALSHMPRLGIYAAEKLANDQELNEKLIELVKRVVNDSVGPIIGSLVYRKVYESIKDGAIEYISDPEKLIELYEKAEGFTDEILNKPLKELMGSININEEAVKKAVLKIEEILLKEDTGDKLISFITGEIRNKISVKDKSLYDVIIGINKGFDEAVYEKLASVWDNSFEPRIYEITDMLYEKLILKIMDTEVKYLAEALGYEKYSMLKEFAMKNKDSLIEKAAGFVSEKLDIRHMVEDKINELDVKLIEDIVLDIARKELNYITYMGGVFGFIIGLIPEIIRLIQ